MRIPTLRQWWNRGISRLASFTTRALIVGSIAVAAFWLLASAATLWTLRAQMMAQQDAVAANTAIGMERVLDHSIELVDQSLRNVADGVRNPKVRSLDAELRHQMLFGRVALLPTVAFVDALDADGDTIASLQPPPKPTNWATRDYFVTLRREPNFGLHVGLPFSRGPNESPGIPFSRRLDNPDGSFGGVVVCGIRLTYFSELFTPFTLGRHGTMMLLRGDGVVLMRLPAEANAVGHVLDPAAPLARAIQLGGGRLSVDDPIDHARRNFTLRRVGSRSLTVAVGMAPEDMPADNWIVALAVGAVGVILTLLTVGLALRLRVELRLREAAEEVGAGQTEFLRTTSHQLRGPLHAILGTAEQLLGTHVFTEHDSRGISAIVDAARLQRTIINQLIDYCRLGPSGVTPRMQPTDLVELLERCCARVEAEAQSRSLTLRCTIAPNVPRSFVTDPDCLRHAVANLLENALKFTDSGGVELRCSGNAAQVRIEVVDTGPGIAPENVPRLFSAYDRLNAEVKGIHGSGLGLSIASRMVRGLGGKLTYSNNPVGGSIFAIEVPAGVAAAPAEPPEDVAPPSAAECRVLVVDDSEPHREIATTILRHEGYEVVTVSNGGEAIWLAAHQRFDVILLDMSMPMPDGLETARRIRQLDAPAGTVPIVAMTANVLHVDVQRYRSAGLELHLAKPFSGVELLAVVAAATGGATHATADHGATEHAPTSSCFGPAEITRAEQAVIPGRNPAVRHLQALAEIVTTLQTNLQDGAVGRDVETVERLAHAVVGDAGILGFTELSDVARTLMTALEQEGEVLMDAVARFCDVADEALRDLRHHLNSSGGESGQPASLS